MQDDAREVDFQSMHGQHERLTTNKKILEHCEDWQEEEGRGVPVSRYIVASGTFPAMTGHHSMEEKWFRALGLALIERRLKQWSKRDINHWKTSGIPFLWVMTSDKGEKMGNFFRWIRRTKV